MSSGGPSETQTHAPDDQIKAVQSLFTYLDEQTKESADITIHRWWLRARQESWADLRTWVTNAKAEFADLLKQKQAWEATQGNLERDYKNLKK